MKLTKQQGEYLDSIPKMDNDQLFNELLDAKMEAIAFIDKIINFSQLNYFIDSMVDVCLLHP